MRHRLFALALLAACTSLPVLAHNSASPTKPAKAAATRATVDTALAAAIAGDWRTADNVARDRFRNPGPTLTFFGLTPAMTVIEVSPGSAGWWTEILAPWLKANGTYIAAIPNPAKAISERARDFFAGDNAKLREKLAAAPAQFAGVVLREVDSSAPVYGEPGSADAVLTFRNLHGWIRNDIADEQMAAFFAVLKPGGVLGVEQHRAAIDVPKDQIRGYVSEAQVIALAEAAGFVLEARSEINANPKDDRDHPNGVWTLPPTLNVPEGEDRAVFEAIGESDRMTLRFRKPAA